MGEKIGLLGGTFDPVHKGHVAIARSFLDSGYIDHLWILPSPVPPHKQHHKLTPLSDRKKMLELAFEDMDGILITDIETALPDPSYTIQTLEYLQQRYPGKRFYLCIGKDSLAEFKTWQRPNEIINRVELLVADRPDNGSDQINHSILERSHFVDHRPVEVSSTELRSLLESGQDERAEKLMPKGVLKYIKQNKLYGKH